MDLLLDLLAGRDESLDLDRAALEVARIEYPGLDFEPSLGILDSIAKGLARRLGRHADGEKYVEVAGRYLFGELGFHGNTHNYYDPRNSCLNDVLGERTGIPITLSVLYMEIGRRLGRPVLGVGLPGHFVAAYRDAEYATFVDVFHGGNLLPPVPGDTRWLALAGKRQIVIRMLHNLRGVYLQRRAYAKARRTLELLLASQPEAAERTEIEKQLRALRRYQAGLN